MSGMDSMTMDGAREVRDELHALGLDGDLFMRLTGFYRVGPDGPVEPEFGYRDFTGSDLRQPIQTDAAAMIRELLAHRRASQAAPAPSYGLREAVERLNRYKLVEDGPDYVRKMDVRSDGPYLLRVNVLAALTPAPASPAQEGDRRHD